MREWDRKNAGTNKKGSAENTQSISGHEDEINIAAPPSYRDRKSQNKPEMQKTNEDRQGLVRRLTPLLSALAGILLALAALFIFFGRFFSPSTTGSFYGEVNSMTTGAPLSGIRVTARSQSGSTDSGRQYSFITGEDGSFHLELPPGEYTLLFEGENYDPYETKKVYSIKKDADVYIDSISLTQKSLAKEGAAEEIVPDDDTTTARDTVPDNDSTTARDSLPDNDTTTARDSLPDDDLTTARDPLPDDDLTTARDSLPDDVSTTAQDTVEPSFEENHFSINASQVEDYGQNLDPSKYLRYSSSLNPGFVFYYPPSLYNKVVSNFDSVDIAGGQNLETHTFTGSKGSVLSFSIAKRDSIRTRAEDRKRLIASESSEIVRGFLEIPAEPPQGSDYLIAVFTGYDIHDNIIYKLIRITQSNTMLMRIQCPPYKKGNDDKDKNEKRYVQECLYRYCSFANDGHKPPRPYNKYLNNKEE